MKNLLTEYALIVLSFTISLSLGEGTKQRKVIKKKVEETGEAKNEKKKLLTSH